MKFGLKDNELAAIANTLARFSEIDAAIIYGSRAKGNYRPASDIDLALSGKNIDLTLLNKIASSLDDLLLPYTFDLSALNKIDNADLVDHINRVGITFYEKHK